ncbi:hypothetical protein PoB_000057600 [Plakobranchus ocellatus]|uniref:ERAP1-like C-terminal domain-containing protein n=1 Tax=Plakobranchus ocellatus TaxID=259542 RepID=A0AAV3XT14_9GAST|nr:hypothetical protein PoB_000057600 [Plakobranchus ocellatus]
MYKENNIPPEKKRLLKALSCSDSTWILSYYLSSIIKEKSLISQKDTATAIGGVALKPVGRYVAWNFFKSNFDLLYEKSGKEGWSWKNLVEDLTSFFNTEFYYQELEQLSESKADKSAAKFKSALTETRTKIQWLSKNYQSVVDFLEEEQFPVAELL